MIHWMYNSLNPFILKMHLINILASLTCENEEYKLHLWLWKRLKSNPQQNYIHKMVRDVIPIYCRLTLSHELCLALANMKPSNLKITIL